MTEPSHLPPCPPLPQLKWPLHWYDTGTYCMSNTTKPDYPGRPFTVYAVCHHPEQGRTVEIADAYETALEAVQVYHALSDQIKAVRRLVGVEDVR